MASRENRWNWWIILGSLVIGGAVVAALLPSQPAEIEYLPSEVVVEEVIPQEMLDEMAAMSVLNHDLTLKNGQLRDQNGRLVRVNTRLKVDTGAVAEPTIITEWREADCDSPVPVRREYRATLDAFQFRGLDDEGELAFGWRGTIGCDVRRNEAEWLSIVQRPFSLSQVEVVSSERPEPVRASRVWYAGLQVSVLNNSTRDEIYDDYRMLLTAAIPCRVSSLFSDADSLIDTWRGYSK